MKKINERMELALNGSRTAILDWDFTDNSFYISPNWKEMLGFNNEELPNSVLTWKQRVHRDDKKSIFQTLKKHKANQIEYFEANHRLKHKNGHWVWVLARAQILYDKNGKAIRMVGTHSDITEEKKLLHKASCQAQMLDHIHDAIISADIEGVITSWNAGAEALLGYTKDEVASQDSTMLYPKEDLEARDKNIEMLMQKGKHHITIRLVTKAKEIIYVDLSLSLLRDDNGDPVGRIGYIQDISIRKEAEVLLREQHKYLQSIIDNINDPIMVIKEDYTVDLMNSILHKELKNIKIADQEHPKCYEISHNRSTPCDGFDHPCPLRDVIDTKEPSVVIHNHYNPNGKSHYVELSVTPLFDQEKNCIGIIESARDITEHLENRDELEKQKNILHHQAHHDALTGLPNRVLFNDRLEHAIETSKRNNRKIALFFIDFDYFKEINDSLGHKVGDEVLKIVTQRIKSKIRENDTLSRLGGDEFTIIMEDMKQAEDASSMAQKILEVIAEPIRIEENLLYISSSIGISFYPEDGDFSQDLLKYADAAMYKAKNEGRNNFQFYSAEMTELAFERVLMEAGLRAAFKDKDLVVYYQPQVNAKRNKLIGMEALVRWQHPTMGLLLPAKFIPLAKSTGLIVELDKLVMKRAMTQMVEWYDAGLKPGLLALNLSMRLLQEKDFISTLEKMLIETKCKPEWLEFEVTEAYIMRNPDKIIKILNKISELGIKLSVDDFGTGYSSLSYLKKLPIDKLKIDRSFVKELPHDQEDITIVKAVIALAKSLNLSVIAEGVETEEQKTFLLENGCQEMQGYFYGKPMPKEEMEVILLEGDLI